MYVSTYCRIPGETMIEIGLYRDRPRDDDIFLSWDRARELYSELTRVLEAEHNASQRDAQLEPEPA